ncbi:MAG: hypothetical protein JXB23_15555 [Candidatus Aminicenantes bacterium]|nr:hypothetical protein [Candidatus Aminicenantes bacterium]
MRTSKWLIILCTLIFLVGFTACGGGKYGDAKKIVAKSNKVVEDFLGKLDKADNAKEVATALKGFAKAMKEIAPEMKKLQEKYPEMAKSQSIPPELGEEGKKMMEVWSKMGMVMMKIQKYADDPEVQAAQQEFENVMKGF